MAEKIWGTGWFSAPNAIFGAEISPQAKIVYLNLCRRAGPDGSSWPSHRKIGLDCSISERSAYSAVDELVRGGWVERISGGAGVANTYRVVTPTPAAGAGVPLQPVQPKDYPTEGRREEVLSDLFKSLDRDVKAGTSLVVQQPPSLARDVQPTRKLEPLDTSFGRFWGAYPRKVGKMDALKAWIKNGCNALADTIVMAVSNQKSWPQWTRDQGQFIPHPATWLNRHSWEDERPQGLEPAPGQATGRDGRVTSSDINRLLDAMPKEDWENDPEASALPGREADGDLRPTGAGEAGPALPGPGEDGLGDRPGGRGTGPGAAGNPPDGVRPALPHPPDQPGTGSPF